MSDARTGDARRLETRRSGNVQAYSRGPRAVTTPPLPACRDHPRFRLQIGRRRGAHGCAHDHGVWTAERSRGDHGHRPEQLQPGGDGHHDAQQSAGRHVHGDGEQCGDLHIDLRAHSIRHRRLGNDYDANGGGELLPHHGKPRAHDLGIAGRRECQCHRHRPRWFQSVGDRVEDLVESHARLICGCGGRRDEWAQYIWRRAREPDDRGGRVAHRIFRERSLLAECGAAHGERQRTSRRDEPDHLRHRTPRVFAPGHRERRDGAHRPRAGHVYHHGVEREQWHRELWTINGGADGYAHVRIADRKRERRVRHQDRQSRAHRYRPSWRRERERARDWAELVQPDRDGDANVQQFGAGHLYPHGEHRHLGFQHVWRSARITDGDRDGVRHRGNGERGLLDHDGSDHGDHRRAPGWTQSECRRHRSVLVQPFDHRERCDGAVTPSRSAPTP